MSKALPIAAALIERRDREEIAITALVSGELERWSEIECVNEESLFNVLEVHLHIGNYIPPAFGNGACLAVMGPGRDFAQAKYSDWVRLRKPLERLRPPSVTELLLSNDGDQLLEGCVTNFFVVCRKVLSGQ
uniref:Uncharacterized protein n=1 Tax=Rhizophora mucronata TaxID=61149 RepID=A0A2P2IIU4_RHIMU